MSRFEVDEECVRCSIPSESKLHFTIRGRIYRATNQRPKSTGISTQDDGYRRSAFLQGGFMKYHCLGFLLGLTRFCLGG